MSEFTQYFNQTHDLVRQSVRKFVTEHITPNIKEWEEAGSFPRELYHLAGEAGILGLGYSECYGGVGEGDVFMKVAASEELMRSGSGGLVASLGSIDIAVPPIAKWGSEELKKRVIPELISGRKIAALAITEPSGGSDVASIKTRAVSEGDFYRVSGSKTYITSGTRADYYTVAVRTGGDGYGGLSLLLIEKGMAGFSVGQPLKKMGWWVSDTAELFFDDVMVPKSNLIGAENMGFFAIMTNFQMERLNLATMANMTAQLALDRCLRYVHERTAFGRPLAKMQTIRHKIAEMATQVEISREYNYRCAARIQAGVSAVTEVSMAKNFATKTSDFVTYEATQIFGGMGFCVNP